MSNTGCFVQINGFLKMSRCSEDQRQGEWFGIPSRSQDSKEILFLRRPCPISRIETVLGERCARTWERSWSKADECERVSFPKQTTNVEERALLSDWENECGVWPCRDWCGMEELAGESCRACFWPICEWECRQGTFAKIRKKANNCYEPAWFVKAWLHENRSRLLKLEWDTKILPPTQRSHSRTRQVQHRNIDATFYSYWSGCRAQRGDHPATVQLLNGHLEALDANG